jgi:hypothetical protein
LLQSLQILQIGLFAIPVLGLVTIGLLILIKPILILHRRYFLILFIPLLLANPLALLEETLLPGENTTLDWRLWIVLAVDLGLILAGYWLLGGWQIYGLSEAGATDAIKSWFNEHGWAIDAEVSARTTWWSNKRQARRFQAERENETLIFWLTIQGNEIQLQGENRKTQKYLRQMLANLQHAEKVFQIQEHMAGVLYIILGIVLAVLVWIFFFEPRLILIE